MKDLYRELAAYPNVAGCYVGQKQKRSKVTNRLALVCCVKQKRRRDELAVSELVPPSVPWLRTRTESAEIATDVQEIGATGFQQLSPVVGPGDVVGALSATAETGHATVGVALQHPVFGLVVTTAGHAFIKSGVGEVVFAPDVSGIRVFNVGGAAGAPAFEAQPLKAVVRQEADYALLRPSAGPRNLFQDQFNLASLHFARPEDAGRQLFVLCRRGMIPTVLRGVSGFITIDGIPMNGLLFTDSVTRSGDSGSCLVDNTFRVWGLLVGFTTLQGVVHSVFGAANWVLAFENSQLA